MYKEVYYEEAANGVAKVYVGEDKASLDPALIALITEILKSLFESDFCKQHLNVPTLMDMLKSRPLFLRPAVKKAVKSHMKGRADTEKMTTAILVYGHGVKKEDWIRYTQNDKVTWDV